ncbi:hypothetical protein ZWY2020_001064 [Hordeum vulgare]|nr:hypothetical protein ZWY2020_001064 [Hordeum vulgare]
MCINCRFYFVDAEIEEEAARPHLATATLAPEQPIPDGLVISSDLIRDELATYIGDFRGSEFAWEVTETAPLVFSVPFPSVELLRVCSHGPIRCPINQFMICVQAATAEPDPVPPLEKPVGKLTTTDLASFEDDGPARIEIICPAPAEIDRLSLVFYFGSKGKRLTFELESPAPVVQLDPALTGLEPGDGGLDEERGSSEEGSSSEGDDDTVGAPPEPSDGRRNPVPSVASQSGHAGGTTVGALAPVVAVGTEIPLLASPVPVVAAEEEVSVGMEVCPASSLRSPVVVCYSRSPGSPPSPTLGSPDPRPPVAVDPGWVSESPPVPRSRPREGASPVVAKRQSARISQSRILQDGRVPTIPELAARRAATHDLFPDSGIVFRGEKGPPLEQISASCAKERLEGALAEARCLVARSNPPPPVHYEQS